MVAEQVEVRFMRSPDDGQCLACNFSVERLVEMMHTGNVIWCFPHTQVAIAAGARLAGQTLRPVPGMFSAAIGYVPRA